MAETSSRRRFAPPSPATIETVRRVLARAGRELRAIEPNMAEDDPKLWADMMEGEAEGDPFALIDRLITSALDYEADAEAVQHRRADLASRHDRFIAYAARRRKIARDLLAEADIRSLERPEYTASISPGRPHILPTLPPEQLPERFQRCTIEANKQALGDALIAAEPDVPAEWSNPQLVLTVRTR